MSGLLSVFSVRFPEILVYMLQSVEYRPGPYLAWLWRTNNFGRVMHRRSLDRTRPARLLLLALRLGMLLQLAIGFTLLWLWQYRHTGTWQLAVLILLSYPVIWSHLVVLPLFLGRVLIIGPSEKRLIKRSRQIFATHPATVIAVAGSYGKTSMKELLATVLAEGKKVAATPGNMNVAISHARFASRLDGDEDILIIEYGEGKPGDVAEFAKTTQPDIGVITGLAPAHLDRYKTLEAAADDIFSLAEFLSRKRVYASADSASMEPYLDRVESTYSQKSALGWQISKIVINYDGTSFTMKKDNQALHLHSALLGRHQVGPLALVAALAIELGLTPKQVEAGIAKTVAFEHRLQPRPLNGAWLLDDTYNGNIEGVRVGLELLQELPARQKIYVTPGLVDQGEQTETIHQQMGAMISQAKPDRVVLMQNSVTNFIKLGLDKTGYSGKVDIITDPLHYYTNLEYEIAAGDLILMQNDWTDNYN
jgi:UDP-N-acetylmuramoyl-tripeptide--D-alanyl-D-alanine ligase